MRKNQMEENRKDWFYSDGTIRIERHTLMKEGFPEVKIRKIYGIWEILEYKFLSGDESWKKLNPIVFTEEKIQEQIKLYEKIGD
jgi:hypothetical protein